MMLSIGYTLIYWRLVHTTPSCFVCRNLQQSSNQDLQYLFLNDRKTDEPWLLDLHCDKLSREMWGGAMSAKDGAYAAKGCITALATHMCKFQLTCLIVCMMPVKQLLVCAILR